MNLFLKVWCCYVHGCLACVIVCVLLACLVLLEARIHHQIPCNWSLNVGAGIMIPSRQAAGRRTVLDQLELKPSCPLIDARYVWSSAYV